MIQFIALEYVNPDQNSNKFWHGAVFANGTLVIQWGRNGTQGQSKTHECGSVASALAKLNKLTGEKIGKGYQQKHVAPQQNQQSTELQTKQKSMTEISSESTGKVPKVSESTPDDATKHRSEYVKWLR